MKWEKKKIEEVCYTTDYVANGSFQALSQNVKYLREDGYAILIRLDDFSKGWNGDYKYVSKSAYEFLDKTKLFCGDLILSNVGSYGKTFFVPELGKPMTLGPNAILVRPDYNILNKKFLKYFFDSSIGQDLFKRIANSTAQPKFNKTQLRSLEILIPACVLTEFFLNSIILFSLVIIIITPPSKGTHWP